MATVGELTTCSFCAEATHTLDALSFVFFSFCRAFFHLKAWYGVNSWLVGGLTMQRRDIKRVRTEERTGEVTEDPEGILCYLFTQLNSTLVFIKN